MHKVVTCSRLLRMQRLTCSCRMVQGKRPELLSEERQTTIARSTNFSSAPDYGKYADPGKVEAFYDWLTDTSWIRMIESCLTSVHDLSGMPWWATIATCTVVLRSVVMTPLFVVQMKNSIKYMKFLPLFARLQDKLLTEVNEEAKKRNWDEKTSLHQYRVNLIRHRTNLYKQHRVPGLLKRYILPLVQLPIWVSMSIAIRHLTGSLPVPTSPDLLSVAQQLSLEGCLWFPDLCLIDPLYILPLLFGLTNLSIIEIHRGDGKTKLTGFNKALVYAVRTITVVMIPVAMQMPSGVVFYWTCSSLYGAVQALAFKSKKVKKLFKIPISPHESKTPYSDLLNRLKFRK